VIVSIVELQAKVDEVVVEVVDELVFVVGDFCSILMMVV
jgi:hypothetical protein